MVQTTSVKSKNTMRSICALIFLLFFTACSQSVIIPEGSGNAYIKFKVNGAQQEFTGSLESITGTGIGVYSFKQLASSPAIPKTRYSIQGQSGANRLINLVLITDTLKAQEYTTTSTTAEGVTFAKVDSMQYANYWASDVLTVNVSRHSGNTIDGTFSGNLSAIKRVNGATTYTTATVTEGEFKNVQIIY